MDNTDLVLESFIEFCDDMMIAEEGLIKDIGKQIWVSIKSLINKIVTWFKNLLLNINYFKNAKLNPKYNSDLVYVLKTSQAHTENNFRMIAQMYKTISSLGSCFDNAKDFHVQRNLFQEAYQKNYFLQITNLDDQINKCNRELNEIRENTRNSDQYKRIVENNYDENDTQSIPLTYIVKDIKKCNTEITEFKNYIDKFEAASYRLKTEDGKAFLNKAIGFFNNVISYYSFRMDILGRYMASAKASLNAFGSNIAYRFKKDSKLRSRYNARASRLSLTLSRDVAHHLMLAYNNAKLAKTYEEYKPHYDKIIKLLNLKGEPTIQQIQCNTDNGLVIVQYNKNKTEKVPISKNQNLYHGSFDEGLTELKPSWLGGGQVLFPKPRIYFHANVPLNRWSFSEYSLRDEFVSVGGLSYRLKVNPEFAFVDPELGGTAMYVETTKPIPVELLKEEDYAERSTFENPYDRNKYKDNNIYDENIERFDDVEVIDTPRSSKRDFGDLDDSINDLFRAHRERTNILKEEINNLYRDLKFNEETSNRNSNYERNNVRSKVQQD